MTDFTRGEDRVWLSDAGFGGRLVEGPLGAGFLTLGAAAVGASPQLVDNAATGILGWDADGAGGAALVPLATLTTRPALDATDFLVMA